MTQAAKRAAELANAEYAGVTKYKPIDFEDGHEIGSDAKAFRKYIQHASDAAKRVRMRGLPMDYVALDGIILPDEPDPLVEIMGNCIWQKENWREDAAKVLRAELASRGLCIAPIKR